MSSHPNNGGDAPAVHFASKDTEMEPETTGEMTASNSNAPAQRQFSHGTQAQLNQLSEALGDTHLQNRRISQFHFDTISLPASRVSGTYSNSSASSVHGPPSRSNSRFTASQLLMSSFSNMGVPRTTIALCAMFIVIASALYLRISSCSYTENCMLTLLPIGAYQRQLSSN